MEMNFCRRCGAAFVSSNKHVYSCENGHTIYANASPAVGLILSNKMGEVVVLKRGIDPGKGMYDLPGGYCDGAETLEDAVAREIEEEIGLTKDQYSKPVLVSSGIDPYEIGGETVSALASVFSAVIIDENATLNAADDAESFSLKPLNHETADTLYFPSLRHALHTFVNNDNKRYNT